MFTGATAASVMRLLLRNIFVLIGIAFCGTRVQAQTATPTLTSDKGDYPPGATATLTGTGFAPGEKVTLQVLHADYVEGDSIGEDHQPWEVTADSAGNFITTWHVCEDDCVGATLRATAVGQTSGQHAEVLFTDANPTPFTATISPTAVCGLKTANDTIVIKNTANGAKMVAGKIKIPGGYTFPTIISFSTTASGFTWSVSINASSDTIVFTSNDNNKGLNKNEVLTIVVGATNPSTSGNYVWTTLAYQDKAFSPGQAFDPLSSQPTVVVESTPPTARCKSSLTVNLNATGLATITAADIDSASFDVCGIKSRTINKASFDCSNKGNNSVILTVTDSSGNAATCSTTVVVKDTLAPVAKCQPLTVYLDPSGQATLTAVQVNDGSFDNCSIKLLSLSKTSFDCSNLGANADTLRVTDSSNNTAYCIATITVQDTIAPVAKCQPLTVYLNASGQATINADSVNNGSSDACGIESLSINKTDFTCSNVGSSNPVVLTVTDKNGNVSTCTSMVTVKDTIAPVAQCRNLTVYLNASGQATINADSVNNGSSDACGIESLSINKTDFSCSNVGASNPVVLTVTDKNGNASTCTSMVTVKDTIAPVAQCRNLTVYLNASGQATINADSVNNGSSDACGIESLSINKTDFSCSNVDASNPVVLTVTDKNGNVATCTSMVTVKDTIAPVAQCRNLTLYLNASGQATINADSVNNGSSDACGIELLSINKTDFSCSNVGSSNPVVLTVTDKNGNVSTCTSMVTVKDTIAPVAQCRNLTVYLNASGQASINADSVNNGSSDACGIESLSINKTDFSCSNVGVSNPVVLTVTDKNGNVSTCTSMVTVKDTIAPVAQCRNLTVYLNASGQATITADSVNNGSSDACGIESLSINKTDFTCGNVGASNPVVLTVTDKNGNVSTCTSMVTVKDTIAPVAQCRNLTVYLNVSGQATINADSVNNGSSDACGIESLSINNTSFSCSNVGSSNPVVLTVTDKNGNVSTCTSMVTVKDTIAPIAQCRNLTVYLNASGQATINADSVNNGSSDACGIESLSINKTDFSCGNVGASNPVELTVTDKNGNVSTCTSMVTVKDTIAPIAQCRNLTVYLNAAGQATITADSVNNGSSDACGIESLSINKTDFTCGNVGASNPVVLTVTDKNGNVSTCTSMVTVKDTIAPVAQCRNLTVYLNASGQATINADSVNNGSSDACGIESLSINKTDFSCSNVGSSNPVVLTVTDKNGNVSTCTSMVTVKDTIAPIAQCRNLTVYLDALGQATITADSVNNGSSDACGIESLSINNSSFSCSNVGLSNPVVLTVTDKNGNVSTCTSMVTVKDTIAPVAQCRNLTVYLNASGQATINADSVNNGSSDACGIESLSINKTDFSCSNVGASNPVELTVTDKNGNASTCTSMVTVKDTIAPVAQCRNLTVYLNASGQATITADSVNNGSSDACGIESLSINNSSFSCSNVGLSNPVVLTVTDKNGNVSTCTSMVTVKDTIAPVAQCRNLTVYLNASGQATINADSVNNGSSDACGIESLSINNSSFSCSNVGLSNPVVLTVTDKNGNVSTCTSMVTVKDTIAPVAQCRNLVVYLNASGQATINADSVNNGSSDACGIESLSINKTDFTCSNVGVSNPVVLTVTDKNGNVSTCTSMVTVKDTIAPVAQCRNLTVYLNASGQATITADSVNNGSSDACGIESLSINKTDFTCGNVGSSNPVVLTVTDKNGNVSTCTSMATVKDTIAPIAQCRNLTVYLNAWDPLESTCRHASLSIL